MSSAQGIDTSTITPLSLSVATSNYKPVQFSLPQESEKSTMTLPDGLEVAHPPPPLPDVVPTAPLTIPDVASMEQELKASNTLLNDIALSSPGENSPLAHLQPTELVQSPTGPTPAVVMPSAPISGQAIQLASTAPKLHTPTLIKNVYMAQATNEPDSTNTHYLITGILLVLTITSISVLGLFLYQQATSQADPTLSQSNSLLDVIIEKIPFLSNGDATSTTPEAVWYQ